MTIKKTTSIFARREAADETTSSGRLTALATFRRKIDVFGSAVNGFGRAKTAGPPAVIFEGLW
jgi:hypothetical protein